MRIALVSLDQAWLDKEVNFKRCAEFAGLASEQCCELVVFPEMTLTGYTLDIENAEPEQDSPALSKFGKMAQEFGLNIIFGICLINKDTKRPQNAFCLAQRDATVRVLYYKIHPFSFAGEDRALAAGNTLGYAQCGELRCGASVCYDLRFPEMFAAMASHCDAMINIANWPARRVEHWRALLLARAIENQCFMIGVNRTGSDGNGLHYEKSSLIYSPDGKSVMPVIAGDELDIYDIAPSAATDYRATFPTVRDKRRDLYKGWFE